MTLTFNTHLSSLTQLVVCMYHLSGPRLLYFLKPNLTWCKLGQGQHRVIICTSYDGLESPMLHTKFRRNRSTGSGEDFLRFLPYMGVAAILVM